MRPLYPVKTMQIDDDFFLAASEVILTPKFTYKSIDQKLTAVNNNFFPQN